MSQSDVLKSLRRPHWPPPLLLLRLWLAAFVCCAMLLVSTAQVTMAQEAFSTVDAQAIIRRLELQEAEIKRLQDKVLELQPSAPASTPNYGPGAEAPIYRPAEIEAVFRRLDALEQQGAAKTPTADKKPADDGWKDVSEEKWTVKLGGHVQIDYINWLDASPSIVGDQNYLSYRRLRLVADGTGYGVFDFRLQMTLEPGNSTTFQQYSSPEVKDAYLSVNDIPGVGRVRIGNFFVPFGLEQVTNDTNNIFNERSIPTQGIFCADREVGIAMYNCTADQDLSWAGGVFFDDFSDNVKTRIDDNQGLRASGRISYLPYYDEPSNGRYLIYTGAGVLYTHDYNDSVQFSARPQVQRGPILINSGPLAAGDYTTANVEFASVWGPVCVQAEAYASQIDFNNGNQELVNGAYVHMSYFLTGENRVFERFGQHGAQFGRQKVNENFFLVPGCHGSGAWELKARWSNLNLTNVNAGSYNDFTFGFNWYWTERVRMMFDWIHPLTTQATVFGETESDLIAMRFDFNW